MPAMKMLTLILCNVAMATPFKPSGSQWTRLEMDQTVSDPETQTGTTGRHHLTNVNTPTRTHTHTFTHRSAYSTCDEQTESGDDAT